MGETSWNGHFLIPHIFSCGKVNIPVPNSPWYFLKSTRILRNQQFETFIGSNFGFLIILVDFKKYHGEFGIGMLTLPHEKICGIKKWPFQEVWSSYICTWKVLLNIVECQKCRFQQICLDTVTTLRSLIKWLIWLSMHWAFTLEPKSDTQKSVKQKFKFLAAWPLCQKPHSNQMPSHQQFHPLTLHVSNHFGPLWVPLKLIHQEEIQIENLVRN